MSAPTVVPDRPPVPPATPILSYSPLIFEAPGRRAPLELRIAVPAIGDGLPIILLSHGHGSSNYLASMRGYGPLADFYAAHGFAVIQPTHQDSRTLGLEPDASEGPLFVRSRAADIRFIIDHLAEIEAGVPGLADRIDPTRIAVVGHSLGAHTAAMLAGMRVTDASSGETLDFADPRITAAVLFSPPGDPADQAQGVRDRYPDLGGNDFGAMTTPALIVTGTEDFQPFFSQRRDWRADAYRLSPSPKSLLMLEGAGHMLGGISGYDAAETSDENPARVALLQRLTWAYLRSALQAGDPSWDLVVAELSAAVDPMAIITSK